MSQMLAFSILVFALLVGEWVSTYTKAWIPSMFITGLLFLFGYWTFFPKDIVAQAGMTPNVIGLLVFLSIVNMGTFLSLSDLLEQWKTILIALMGIGGIVLALFTIGQMFFDFQAIVIATPPLVGGVVSTLIMTEAATKAGLGDYAVLAVLIFVMQSFAGYPLIALMLKREGKKLLKQYRNGEIELPENVEISAPTDEDNQQPKLFGFLPNAYNSDYFKFVRIGIVATLAWMTSQALAPIVTVHHLVLGLLFGVIATQIGFLEKAVLKKANAFGFTMMGVMIYVFENLQKATPEVVGRLFLPMISIIAIGVTGMAVMSFIISKVLKVSSNMAFAVSLTALVGFPGDYILTNEVTNALTKDKDERALLLGKMLPPMLTGGFVTVTIVSVILAGIFVDLL